MQFVWEGQLVVLKGLDNNKMALISGKQMNKHFKSDATLAVLHLQEGPLLGKKLSYQQQQELDSMLLEFASLF